MNNVLKFPDIKTVVSHKAVDGSTDWDLLSYEWRERNRIISETFNQMSFFEKQQTMDTVLEMSNELHDLVVKMKKEKGL